MLGIALSALGLLLVLYSGWQLYLNASQEIGIGRLPVLKGSEAAEFLARQAEDIERRKRATRSWSIVLAVGTGLQLIGTLVAAV
jgi:hypothetical protein